MSGGGLALCIPSVLLINVHIASPNSVPRLVSALASYLTDSDT